VELVPARLLAEAVADLGTSADPNNLPRTVEEENRLAWLGVELQPMNRDLARANNVAGETRDGETGALVTAINEGSPAAQAGIPVGSVLLRLKVPGQPLPVEVHMEEDVMHAQAFPWDRLDEVPDQYFDRIPQPWPATENAFTRALTDLGFGTKYTAEFFIEGKIVPREFEVVPGPPDFESAPRFKSEKLGLTVRDLTYDVRRYLQRAPDESGVVVSKIETGSKASVAGVKPYELITHINDQPVNNVKDFEKLSSGSGELKLSIKRMNRGRMATIKAGE
jgi:serine protease Do